MSGRNRLDDITLPRHGGRVEEVAEARGLDPGSLVDFSANMNPLAPPAGLSDYLVEASEEIEIYPDDRYEEFRSSVVDFLAQETDLRLSPRTVIPGNGSVEIFSLFLRTVAAGGGKRVLVPYPSFSEYGVQARLAGLKVDRLSYDEILEMDGKLRGYAAVFLCNPNNPTGVLRDKEELGKFVARCESRNTRVLVDEAFIELASPDESLVELLPDFPNLIVVRSLTKEFTIPGLRLGYGVGTGKIAKRMEKLRPSWNLNCIAASVGSKLVRGDGDLLARSRDYISEERNWLVEKLGELGFSVYPSSTNFLLFRTDEVGITSGELVDRCLDYGVLLRNADSFYGLDEWYVRVAVKKRRDNEELIGALEGSLP